MPCTGTEHLLPGLPLLPRLHVSKGQETLSKAHPGRLCHLNGGGAHGPFRVLSLPSSPGRPPPRRSLSPCSTCCPWWWSTSAVWGCPVTSTTGSTSSWPCEHCPRAPSGGSRPSRDHRVRGGEGNHSDPGVRNVARRHCALLED